VNLATRRSICRLATGLAALTLFAGPALAAFPLDKPIRMVVPYTPGGSIDTVGRLVAEELQKQLGQAVVIDNKPGASGMIGSQDVARAPADGYTLLFNASSQVYMPLVVNRKTYDAEKDFTAIAQVGYVPLAVVVNAAAPFKTLRELSAHARANPKKLTWATSGLGTTSHLTEEMINRELKLDMEIILYKGAVPQLTDVMGGHVSAAVSPLAGATPFIKGGKLRAIAVTSKDRVASMPDVPTVAESGMPGFELLSWYGLWGPANLPREIVDKLNAAVAKAVQSPHVKARFADLSFEAVSNSPEQFGRIVKEEIRRVGEVVRAANIRIDP
jgi:tripartite-type tricarboxylate transporter receptor subunit TctC